MSIRSQLFVVALLSIFVVTPVLFVLMGLLGVLINAICTYIIFEKYWNEL
tara:strand:+ start:946 stop:1095 length:150 start_codon:yes stop_codon:yes gene_type:complete